MAHRRRLTSLAGCWVVFIFMASADLLAAEHTIWQIGSFDQSSHEFNDRAPVAKPDYNPVFTVGKSTVHDWPGRQPGSENAAEGLRPHPFTILFTLPSKPGGTYRLTIAALLYNPRVPHLEISINGRKGTFYFPRKLSYYSGDPAFWSPIYSGGEISVVIPEGALRAGENKLVLTALDNPKDGPGDSWLTYDALRMTQTSGTGRSFSPQVTLKPTIFYVEGSGGLKEVVHVTVNLRQKVRRGTVRLIVAGHHYEKTLSSAPDFGEQRFEFLVPVLASRAPSELILRTNGKTVKKMVVFQPEKKWTLFVVPHAHLDIGYTDYRGKVAEVHDRNLDTFLQFLPDHPEMRWTIDGTWILQRYFASRKSSAQQALLNLIREGRIGVPGQYANLLTGYASLEELIRSTFYAYRLHKKYGIPFNYVNITDVPSYTWSYPSILHAVGIRYFAAASNNDRAPVLLWGKWNTKSPFWWKGPDGSKVLMSYSRLYYQLSFTCQLPASVPACRQSLPIFLQAYDRPSYKPDAALIFGTQVENTAFVPGTAEFVKEWNSRYAYPKILLATFPDYFRYIDKHYGNELPTVSGDGGPYWEDGVGTDARYAAIDRIDQERALSAEKLSTIGTYVQKNVAGEQKQLRKMWQSLILYAEHTFASGGSYSRPDSNETRQQTFSKDQYVVNSRQDIRSIAEQSLSQLADQIHMAAPAIVVFNSLSWRRSGFVETDLNDRTQLKEYPEMKVVPYEILRRGNGYNHIRFMARDVPSMGYVCYRLAPLGHGQVSSATVTALPLTNIIENNYYRVVFDPFAGAIKSIYDKQLRKELVNLASPYRANRYLYVTGGEGSQIVYLNEALPVAKLTVHPSGGGNVTSVRKTPYGTIMTYETSGLNARHIQSEVILFDHQKKIEFIDQIDKKPVMDKEAVYFAFPFAITHPDFNYEIQNGWVDPARNILKGGSLEWFTVRHWVRVSGSGISVGLVPVDAPLVCLGDINRGTWPKEFQPKDATVYSYIMNNYWHTNYFRVQGGQYTFRYALTSGRTLAPESLARFGRAAMTPLEINNVIRNDKWDNPSRPLSPRPISFLEVDEDNVVVENWKAAEDGQGTVLRLIEVGGRSAAARLTFPLLELRQAWVASAVEVNQREIAVQGQSLEVTFKPHEVVTVRILAVSPAGDFRPATPARRSKFNGFEGDHSE
jgi:alpha-mannosidase